MSMKTLFNWIDPLPGYRVPMHVILQRVQPQTAFSVTVHEIVTDVWESVSVITIRVVFSLQYPDDIFDAICSLPESLSVNSAPSQSIMWFFWVDRANCDDWSKTCLNQPSQIPSSYPSESDERWNVLKLKAPERKAQVKGHSPISQVNDQGLFHKWVTDRSEYHKWIWPQWGWGMNDPN